MILPTDIPRHAEIDRLLDYRAPASVSLYLPTDPASNGDAERIDLKTLAGQASSQLRDLGVGAKVVRQFEDEIGYLHELAAGTRTILDDLDATQLREIQDLYARRLADGRARRRRRGGPGRDFRGGRDAAGRHRCRGSGHS
jgi:hypothetical protein